jgi:hypothetical protein
VEAWKRKIIEQDALDSGIPEWKRRAMQSDAVVQEDVGPSPMNLDESQEAPALVRLEVGALDKQEDRLRALQKHYPDARPYGDGDNFIYTNPETGRTNLYNTEARLFAPSTWFSLGDVASATPEIAEMLGGIGGAVVGGVGGGATGTAVPVPVVGTISGAAIGSVTGAGAGAAGARDLTQRAINGYFGNDDTRSTGEYLTDTAQTFALGAGGEAAGRAIGFGYQGAKNAWNKRLIGEIDPTEAIAKRVEDMRAIGIEPTVGMATGGRRAANLEHALIDTRNGHVIQDAIDQAYGKQGAEFDRIVHGISDAPASIAEAGEAIRRQTQMAKEATKARTNELYKAAGEKITSPATIDATTDFLKRIEAERAGFNSFDKLTKTKATDRAYEAAAALVSDAQNGMTFDQLKEARTIIGGLAEEETDKLTKARLNDLYHSIGADMQSTAYASSPEAQQAFNKANNQFRRSVSANQFGDKSVAAEILNKKDTDQLFGWATANVKNGGNRIAQTRRIIERSEGGKEAWDQTVAGFTERLGLASNDEFDPGAFMRNWNKVSGEAKDAMFKGTKNAQYRKDLDRLAGIADHWTKYRKSANHSNTAAHQTALNSMNPLSQENLVGTALGTAGVMASGGTAAAGLAVGAAKGGAKAAGRSMSQASRVKLLTDPATVNWLADIGKAHMQKGGLKAHIGKLYGIRNTVTRPVAIAIDEYLRDAGIEE